MPSLVELLGTYAPGHALEHGGVTFVFGRVDQAAKAALTVAYFRRAREAVYALRDEVTPEEYERQLSRVTDAYRRGEYAFPAGESYRYYLGEGLHELVAQLTGRPPAECGALCQERSVEALHVTLCVVMESFPELKKKALRAADGPQVRAMLELLSPDPTPPSTPSTGPTSPPGSPTGASTPSSSPGSPTGSSTRSGGTPAATTAG